MQQIYNENMIWWTLPCVWFLPVQLPSLHET